MVVQQARQGAFPPSDAADRFERLLPGVTERTLSMVERLQKSQIESAARAQRLLQADTRRGHYLGAAISIDALLCAAVVGALGYTAAALGLVSLPGMGVAGAFIGTGRKQ